MEGEAPLIDTTAHQQTAECQHTSRQQSARRDAEALIQVRDVTPKPPPFIRHHTPYTLKMSQTLVFVARWVGGSREIGAVEVWINCFGPGKLPQTWTIPVIVTHVSSKSRCANSNCSILLRQRCE